ncbi:hypothetical protein N7448_003204 [Penicillium atrosanguineum]|uniref:Uncharacterized protein n=1 Tax=Penicillium atrosanguineum TaxID=1132637 RepID=A0A9W9H7D4_9EURO|nr:uncharacterized protein N7443_002177 [Penicillium atrosanguineum]KAJ5122073.1 hypothetical protein N7526_009010 [Penicillium atrosanguineum]KAJ5139796.1 hypothetical protein N7448_003204 [Penicillium atrosanguineum]KAJ5309716.1 hypothetical protein N7443_002177 [Penicillium atrosanguineum]KAJ5315239.1 hypothetical protein N7476_005546 [Penicillium atrosanguineum]
MTESLRPGLQPVSHLKAGPTTSSSRSTALHSPTKQFISRPSSRLRMQKPTTREEPLDATSEKATQALIRRVLCPSTSSHGASSPQPLEELLPPLTSSNDVDRQLYALLAIIIKDFVYSWYSKITPDQAFVNEVLHVVAHCTRALEQRLRQVDVAQLALDEVPALVEAHIISYRLAKKNSHLSGLSTSHRALYHEINPHPGLSPVPDSQDPDTITAQSENEAAYRKLLASGILAVLLPTEDLENSSLRTLVGDILSDLILGNQVSGKICEGVFFWEVITKLATVARQRKDGVNKAESTNDTPPSRLEQFGLLGQDDSTTHQPTQSQLTVWIWNVLQSVYLGYVALRFIATGLFRVASNPGPGSSHGAGVSFPAATPGSKKEGVESSSYGITGKRPVVDYRVFSMASTLFDISQRMPWLSGLVSLSQHLILAGPGRVGDTDGVLDRFLRETIEDYVLPPTLLPNLLLATRSTLFPANARPSSLGAPVNTGALAPTPQVSVQSPPSGKALTSVSILENVSAPAGASDATGKSSAASNSITGGGDQPSPSSDPSLETISSNATPGSEKSLRSTEIASIKRRCAASLLAVIPPSVARTFFGLEPSCGNDRTCSAATGSSPSLTIASPPPSSDEKGGDHSGSSFGAEQAQPTSMPQPSAAVNCGNGADGRTDEVDAQVDPEEEYLLQAIENDLLDLLSDEYCNKHLVYSIIETVLAKVLPEMTERGVAELMEDRGVAPVPSVF